MSQAAGLGSPPGLAFPGGPWRAGRFRGIAWEVTRRSELYFIMVRTKRADQLITEVSKSAFILPFSMPARSFPLMYTPGINTP